MSTHTKGHVRTQDTCKPRREASGETKPVDTLASDFQPPEQWEMQLRRFSPASVVIYRVALAHWLVHYPKTIVCPHVCFWESDSHDLDRHKKMFPFKHSAWDRVRRSKWSWLLLSLLFFIGGCGHCWEEGGNSDHSSPRRFREPQQTGKRSRYVLYTPGIFYWRYNWH